MTAPTERAEAVAPEWQEVNSIDEMQAFYLSRLPAIREAARQSGYAIGLHGSARRDFDLMAFPWVEAHASKDELARAIHKAACGFTSASYHWTEKPCGRVATSFPICWPNWHDMISAGCIDLSIPAEAQHQRAVELVGEARKVLEWARHNWIGHRHVTGPNNRIDDLIARIVSSGGGDV